MMALKQAKNFFYPLITCLHNNNNNNNNNNNKEIA